MSEASRLFACEDCGCPFDLTARAARLMIEEKRKPLCARCRTDRRVRPRRGRFISVAEHRYWTDRFGVQGAIELALSIWGPIERSSPAPVEAEVEYLAASATPDLQSVA